MTLLRVKRLSLRGTADFALRAMTFSQRRLEKLAIAGETGAGKSTLLRAIAGLEQAEEGEIVFERRPVPGPAEKLVPGHPGIAYLSQHFELQKFLRVEQVLEYANVLSDDDAAALFRLCQIDHLLQRDTRQLSGGERQRVAICRLLISAPRLLLLDEPYAHLDRDHKETLKSVIADIGARLGITCTLVSHEPTDALPWADRILVMREGAIVQQGAPEEVYHHPVDAYTAGLFGAYNLVDPDAFHTLAPIVSEKKLQRSAEGRRLFFRPEKWKVTGRDGKSVRGKVESVSFVGSHREAVVLIGGRRYQLRSMERLREGQFCYLTFRDRDLWFL